MLRSLPHHTGAVIALLLPATLSMGACTEPPVQIVHGIAITDVTVVNVIDGTVAAGMTVIVEGARIGTIAPEGRLVLGEAVETIDGTDRFLIPGLWDMHVHAIVTAPGASNALTLFVANGVTGVRDMWGMLAAAGPIRDAVAAGEHPGPRFVVAGNMVDGSNPWWPGSNVASTPEEGAALVDSLVDAGAGFIKLYSLLDRDVFGAIAARARQRGIDVVGHVPFSVPALAASGQGMRSMAHLFGVTEGCSEADETVRAQRAAWLAQRAAGETAPFPFFDPGLYRQLLDGRDPQRCDELMDVLAANETWLAPTLTVLRSFAHLDDSVFKADSRLAYMPAATVDGWNGAADFIAAGPNSDGPTSREFYRMQLDVAGTADEHGVPIMAGTDTPNPFVFPGFSLHDELVLLVEAGLTPLAALQAATIAPARFLSATDSLGTVEAGKLADLVLLDADPLDDIANTTRIVAVFANGRLYDRARLDAMLEGVKTSANPN